MKQIADEDRWNTVFKKVVPRLLFNVLATIFSVFQLTKKFTMKVEWVDCLLNLTFILLFFFLSYWYIKLLVRGKKYIKYCKYGIREKASLTQVVIKDSNIVIFFYEYEINNRKIIGKDSSHILDRDYKMLDLTFEEGNAKVKAGTQIPIFVYKNKSIVLFHECGFLDIAHTQKKELITWDYIPN